MRIFCFEILVFAVCTSAQDPCKEGNFIELDHVAKRSPSFDMDSTPLCDRYITEEWYRAKSHVMSTSPPVLGKCGTLYPVWLRDPIPSDGVTQNLTACGVGFSNNCEKPFSIEVKNCTAFLVYKLKPLDSCNSAYCFENDDECVNESIHDVRVTFNNITWNKTEDKRSPGFFQYAPSVNLICSFTPSDDDSLLYHIDWYVDNETVIQGQTVDKSSLDDAILSAADLNKAGKKINTWIHCVVGLKSSIWNPPCFTQSSPLFFAGIEILNQTLTIKRKGKSELMLRPTIPFAAETLESPNGQHDPSPLNIQLSFPGNTEAQCKTHPRANLYECSSKIQSFKYNDRHKYEDKANWYKIHTIEVSNSDDEGYYMSGNKLVLRLETNSPGGAEIFSDVVFHDVHINVVEDEEAWKGKRCSSYADPHQTTFDGYAYECQDTGCITGKTYIFYRNNDHLQEVQVRHENCWGRPRCICAVAVRSGQDVFTIDACYRRQYINFPICNDNSLKVIKKTDKEYKIVFPTGTSVKVDLYNYGSSFWYINLEVYPTIADVNRTSGLCGVLDDDKSNDLRRRDGTQDNIHSYNYYNPPDSFSLSWQIPDGSTEDLLSKSQTVFDQLTPLSAYFHKLCTCVRGTTDCSYKQYKDCKTNVRGREYHCVLHSSPRKKRDLEFLTRFQEDMAVKTEKVRRVKRQALNEVDAYDICNDAFQQATYYDTCLQIVPNFSNETLVNCMNDLAMTGDHNLTQLHLDTALGQCQTYILLNSTLMNEHPGVTTVIVNLCPNNCSNRGICSSGDCTCEYGFGGSDCSFDVSSPPTITRLSGDGVCDKSSESCDDITLYGHYFLENMGTTCYMTREEMDGNNIETSETSYTVALQERTLYEGFCSLEHGLGLSYYTTFHFNLSNDGTQFSPQYTVYVYQSACQTFQNISGKIEVTLQSGYCYINGTCIKSGTLKSNDSCWQCLALSNSFDWTFDCTNTEGTPMSTISSSAVPLSTSSSTVGPLSTSSLALSISPSTTSSIATSQSTIPLSGTLSQTTRSPLSMAPTTSTTFSVQTTSSTTQESTTKNVGSQESVSTTKQPGTTSLNGVVTSAALSTTSTLPTTSTVKGLNSGTTKILSNSDDEATNKQTNQVEGLSAVAIGLIVAVAVVVAVIVAIAGYMIKQMKTNDDEHKPLDNSIEDNVNIYPDSNRTMPNRGNFNPTDLLQFDSPADKFSRPPSATSTRMLPPHQDFRKMYDQSHLDKLFGAKRY